MHKLDEWLEHSGTKGMKWGVRHDDKKSVGETPAKSEPKPKERNKLGKHLDSLKRERSWKNSLKDIHNMTTQDIRIASKRISLENDLKGLSRGKMGTKKDKADYLRRHEMSDQELSRKIARLQAKESLHKAVRNASKEQRELGIKVAQTAGSIGVKYALNGGRPTGTIKDIAKSAAKDAMDVWEKPKENWDKSEGEVITKIGTKNQFAADAIKFVLKQQRAKNKDKK